MPFLHARQSYTHQLTSAITLCHLPRLGLDLGPAPCNAYLVGPSISPNPSPSLPKVDPEVASHNYYPWFLTRFSSPFYESSCPSCSLSRYRDEGSRRCTCKDLMAHHGLVLKPVQQLEMDIDDGTGSDAQTLGLAPAVVAPVRSCEVLRA